MTEQNAHIDLDQLWAYLDGVLEPIQGEAVKAHLADCPLCKAEFARLEGVTDRLESLPEIALARDLSSLVVGQLREERSLSPAITWTLVAEALAAGGVIAILIPIFQAAGWLPRLLGTGLEIRAGINIFLAQLASGWLVWWAGLKLQFSQLMGSFSPTEILRLGTFSPWILIGAAGGLVVLTNALLLGRQSLLNGNHQGNQI